ncbi:MFS transporter [Labrys sp. KNU-23]|uniref:MFS transporter n=1 Tax=Labrys sp. KNU-23 TaxID=2789216 RepID=UPI0011ECA49B|nr:MFS transporter [Labrys sp. KNU-23]QEN87519.1 MFS transporter [Labrys sp. KNU-23]
MDSRVLLLALATFVTGTAENIVIGILPQIAAGLGVSIGLAGQLTAVFSITFALAAPLALLLTARFERKHAFVAALAAFVLCSLLAAASPGYGVLFVARIGMAAASATIALLATMLATELVDESMKGRAIGVIFMGMSGSMVLGVPVGMLICSLAGWRSVFAALAGLALLVLFVCRRKLPEVGARRQDTPDYWAHLRSAPLVSAQLVSILMISGHFVLFAYLSPYIAGVLGIAGMGIVFAFIAFGVAGVSGGYLGGLTADKLTPRRAIVLVPAGYLTALMLIPLAAGTAFSFFPIMMVWACLSWMISPAVQSFLITSGPRTAEAGVSLNLSAMHIGVGLGTALGGIAVEAVPIAYLPGIGAMLAALALMAALLAYRGAAKPNVMAA